MELTTTRPSLKGPPEMFTGDVWFEVISRGDDPSHLRALDVVFTPGSRTRWHRHAMGQTFYVVEGVGYVQARGGEVVELHPGDVVHTPPGEWHWHGAAPDSFMAHIAMWEGSSDLDDGATWGEEVSDAEYDRRREG